MKGCLLLQRNFAYVGHEMARVLRDEYGVSEFCGYVYLRPSYDFLKTQKDIPYTALLLDSEIHDRYKTEPLDLSYIKRLEATYGIPFLWPFLKVDRVLMSNQLIREYPYDRSSYTHEELLRLIQVYGKAIEQFLDAEKPDFLFCSVIGGLGSRMLFEMAKRRGIPTHVVLPACLRDRWVLSDTYDRFTGVEQLMTNDASRITASHRQEAEQFLREFRERPIPYYKNTTPEHQPVTRTKQVRFLRPDRLMKTASAFVQNLRRYYAGGMRFEYDAVSPWNYLRDATKRKLRNVVGVQDLYDEFDPTEDFAFFPLHYEPEVALLLQAPYQTDQLHLIRQIAQSLPVHFKLYVKEHPAMVEFRPRSFYRELKRIHNVKLIPPTISGFAVIPHAKLITTITGTVGWEAVMLNKPVVTFGHQFYNALSTVKYCGEVESLPQIVKGQLEQFRHDEQELVAFIAAIFQESAILDLPRLWNEERDLEKKREGLRPLTELLASKLNLRNV